MKPDLIYTQVDIVGVYFSKTPTLYNTIIINIKINIIGNISKKSKKIPIMIIDILNPIFLSIDSTKTFLLDNAIITNTILCSKDGCNGNARLYVVKSNGTEILQYRCARRGCQRRKAICSSKLTLNKLLHCIYLLLNDTPYQQMNVYHGVSSSTISSIKKKLIEIYKVILNNNVSRLGGNNITIEIDETVLSRRGIIKNPTTLDDETRDTVWIVGGVEKQNTKNFFLCRVENRKINTLSECLKNYIFPNSILFTDGHPSYPAVSNNLMCQHYVVNHNHGFVADDGTHTNSIEGFWSHVKSSMRKEHGVKRSNIDNWIIQYTFKRRCIIGCTREQISEIFVKILKHWFS